MWQVCGMDEWCGKIKLKQTCHFIRVVSWLVATKITTTARHTNTNERTQTVRA